MLPPVSFGVGRPVREEMVEDINEALDHDVQYELPENYMKGQGDSELILQVNSLVYVRKNRKKGCKTVVTVECCSTEGGFLFFTMDGVVFLCSISLLTSTLSGIIS